MANVPVFKFPQNEIEKQLWILALPNVLKKTPTIHVGICELHWPPDYEKITVRGGKQRPKGPPSLFKTPKSFFQQTRASTHRDLKRRAIDLESRQEQSKKNKLEKDLIASWRDLEHYCAKLPNILFQNTKDSIRRGSTNTNILFAYN